MSVNSETIERLKNLVTSATTDTPIGPQEEAEYTQIRRKLFDIPSVKDSLPSFIRTCSTLKELKRVMQEQGGYNERRTHIRDAFAPLLDDEPQVDPFTAVVVATDLSKLAILPADLQQRGQEMAQIFTYLFCIENSLRLFIKDVGAQYTLTTPRAVQQTIERLKQQETQRKYLPLRGDSDLYYCDFVQLGHTVRANWSVFSQFFPDKNEHWFNVMLDELYAVRCLIAHNSYVGEGELQRLDVFYRTLMAQLRLQ